MNEEFCCTDLYAADAFVVAIESGEKELIRMMLDGIKIHNWLSDRIYEKFEVRVPYKTSKMLVHGLNYGLNRENVSRESGLDKNICYYVCDLYEGSFPGIRLRREKIKKELEATACLKDLLGNRRQFFAPRGEELYQAAYAFSPQSTVAGITNNALIRINIWGRHYEPWMKVSINTHDGLLIRTRIGERDKVKERIKIAYNIPLSLNDITVRIPFKISWGRNFNDFSNEEIIKYDSRNSI